MCMQYVAHMSSDLETAAKYAFMSAAVSTGLFASLAALDEYKDPSPQWQNLNPMKTAWKQAQWFPRKWMDDTALMFFILKAMHSH